MDQAACILYVEDDPDDFLIFQEACAAYPSVRVVHARSGPEALVLLLTREKPPDYTPPCLILLELNLHMISGLEVLRALKTHPELRGIPVIMLSAYIREKDREAASGLGADGFYLKPATMHQVASLANELVSNYCAPLEADVR